MTAAPICRVTDPWDIAPEEQRSEIVDEVIADLKKRLRMKAMKTKKPKPGAAAKRRGKMPRIFGGFGRKLTVAEGADGLVIISLWDGLKLPGIGMVTQYAAFTPATARRIAAALLAAAAGGTP